MFANTHIFTPDQSLLANTVYWDGFWILSHFAHRISSPVTPLPPRVQILQNTSVLRKQAKLQNCQCTSKFHLQEGKQLSRSPFLLYFTHGSHDLIAEGGLSDLCKDLGVSFPRTTSDLDASTKEWCLSKVWNKPLAHTHSSYLNKSSHRNHRCSPISPLTIMNFSKDGV